MDKHILERNQRALNGIKTRLAEFLEFCDENRTPYVCKARHTKEGYKEIEDFVVKSVVYNDLDIMEAVIKYENLLNPNAYID